MTAIRPMIVIAALALAAPAGAETGAQAYERGCGGGCHRSEARVLRAIPRLPDAERRAWIAAFMDRHPNNADDAREAIIAYLTERSRR